MVELLMQGINDKIWKIGSAEFGLMDLLFAIKLILKFNGPHYSTQVFEI